MPELDSVLTLSQRQLGVMKPRPVATLHVGGNAVIDSGFTVSAGGIALPNSCITSAMLADGSVTTPKLVADAAQQYMGGYYGTPTVATSGGSWTDTPVAVTCTFPAGATGMVRVESTFCVYNATIPSYTLFGLGLNAVVALALATVPHVGTSNYPVGGAWISYLSAASYAGQTVRFSLMMAAAAGVTNLHTTSGSSLYVNWQKR